MSSYARQRTESGCGPVAILNAMKWANEDESITYKDTFSQIARLCETDRDGTNPAKFKRALTVVGSCRGNFKVKEMKKFDLDKIYKHLMKGGGLVLGHFELPQDGVDDYEGHYSFWFAANEEEVYGVNVLRKPAATVNIWPVEVIGGMQNRTAFNLKESMEIYLITKGWQHG